MSGDKQEYTWQWAIPEGHRAAVFVHSAAEECRLEIFDAPSLKVDDRDQVAVTFQAGSDVSRFIEKVGGKLRHCGWEVVREDTVPRVGTGDLLPRVWIAPKKP